MVPPLRAAMQVGIDRIYKKPSSKNLRKNPRARETVFAEISRFR